MSEKESEVSGVNSPEPDDRSASLDGAESSKASDSDTSASGQEESRENDFLSYQGAVVPRFLAVLWVIFLIWGMVYLIRYVPDSMMEWFSRD